jgi:23S rRNA pseudouridine2605 synthase
VASKNPPRQVGLARALSKLGYCSRSEAGELIRDGRARLNGKSRRDPETPVHLEKDRIEVDGRAIEAAAKTYLLLNKPRGVVTTASDEKGRKTVYELLDTAFPGRAVPWVAPVGRLDKASEGLLLLTNDSEWSARVLAPETHLDKIYQVQIGKIADEELLATMIKGVHTDDDFLRVKAVRVVRSGQRNSWIEVVLDEGKNRHIRRLLEKLNVEVLRLLRVAIGPLALGELAKGKARELTKAEKNSLDYAMSSKSASPRSNLRQ